MTRIIRKLLTALETRKPSKNVKFLKGRFKDFHFYRPKAVFTVVGNQFQSLVLFQFNETIGNGFSP